VEVTIYLRLLLPFGDKMKIFNHSYIRVLRDLRWKKEQLSITDSLLLHYERILRGVSSSPTYIRKSDVPDQGRKKKMEATTHHGRLLPFALVGYLDSGLSCYNHYIYIYKDLRCPGAEEKESNYLSQTVTLGF